MAFETKLKEKPQAKGPRIVCDPTQDRLKRKAEAAIEKIRVEEVEQPAEKTTEAKPEEDKPTVTKVKTTEKPAKKTYKRQTKETNYPVALFIKAYGFIRISNHMRKDLGCGQKGQITNLTAEKHADGSITMKKKI